LLVSCDDPKLVGLEVLPPDQQINVIYSDTTTITSKTVVEDSIPTDENISANLLGSYTDPVFGRTDASFYAQLGLSFNPVLGDSIETLTSDSLVLTIQYSGNSYGNLNTPLKVSVFRLMEDMNEDSGYYSNKTFIFDTKAIGSATIVPHPKDSVKVYDKNTSAHIRIRLNDELANEILALNGKGIYVKVDPVGIKNEGSIVYFNLDGTQSRLWLYYHSSIAGRDSLNYYFNFNGARSNHFQHEYAGFDVGKQLLDSTYNTEVNYIQLMAGVRTKFYLPFLKNYAANGPVMINKAELIVPFQTLTDDVYPKLAKLLILAADSTGKANFISNDYNIESTSSHIVQNYDASIYHSDIQAYRFNIAQHLQKIIDGEIPDYGFYIVGTGASVQANRGIISSAQHATRPIQIKISYTKIN